MLIVHSLSVAIQKQSILKDVSFRVPGGNALLITGHNGSGKTTLLRAVAGLVPHQGSIDRAQPRNEMGICIGAFGYGDLPFSENYQIFRRGATQATDQLIHLFQIDTTNARKLKSYSLGWKHKIALCFAFFNHPDLLLLDEPFNALDPGSRQVFQDFLASYLNETKAICLLTTHIPIQLTCPFEQLELAEGKVATQSLVQ